jgi:hypothetical protein
VSDVGWGYCLLASIILSLIVIAYYCLGELGSVAVAKALGFFYGFALHRLLV